MDVTVNRKDFTDLASKMIPVIDRRSTMPVLTHFLIRVQGQKLLMSGSDMYSWIDGSIDCESKEDDVGICVPAKKLLSIIRMSSDEYLKLKKDDETNRLEVSSKKFKYNLSGISPESFPVVPEKAGEYTYFDGQMIRDSLERTLFAVLDEINPSRASSLCIKKKFQQMHFVSTDRRRMCFMNNIVEDESNMNILINKKTASEIKKLCTDQVGICSAGHFAFFDFDGLILSTNMPDLEYIPYENMIPQAKQTFIVDKNEMIEAMSRIVQIDEESNFMLTGNNIMTITSSNDEVGNAEETVNISNDNHAEFIIAFNSQFIIDSLSACITNEVEIGVDKSNHSFVMKSANYTSVIMAKLH